MQFLQVAVRQIGLGCRNLQLQERCEVTGTFTALTLVVYVIDTLLQRKLLPSKSDGLQPGTSNYHMTGLDWMNAIQGKLHRIMMR